MPSYAATYHRQSAPAPIWALYAVQADAETGEWISEPEHIGYIECEVHNRRQDTDRVHYDTFHYDERLCAIEVHWVAAEDQD